MKTSIAGKALILCVGFILLSQVVNAQITMVEFVQLQSNLPDTLGYLKAEVHFPVAVEVEADLLLHAK